MKGKKIVLLKALLEGGKGIAPQVYSEPSDFDEVKLIAKDYGNIDLILCKDHDSNGGITVLYLGHWNDGIV